jgi:hypothetical protein
MKYFLEAFSVPLLLESIFYPLIVIHTEMEAISFNRHRTRSSIKLTILTVIALSFFCSFYNSSSVYSFFYKIVLAFNLNPEVHSLLSNFLGIMTGLHIGSYVSNVIVRSCCNVIFGDPDLYITEQRAMELEQKFIEQGNHKINRQQICEVINFCIQNLRRQNYSAALGAKPEDWKKTIEALLYDADLEHFLDQQQALRNKKRELQIKLDAIEMYSTMSLTERRNSSISSIPERIITSTLPISPPVSPKSSNIMQRRMHSRHTVPLLRLTENLSVNVANDFNGNTSFCSRNGGIEATENTPLLQNIYSQPTPQAETIGSIVNKELERFKKKHAQKSKSSLHQSEEYLIHECKNHLQKIELTTEEAIYPEPLILKLFLLQQEQEKELHDNFSMNSLAPLEYDMAASSSCKKIP